MVFINFLKTNITTDNLIFCQVATSIYLYGISFCKMKNHLQGFFHKLAVWKFFANTFTRKMLEKFFNLLIIYLLELDEY